MSEDRQRAISSLESETKVEDELLAEISLGDARGGRRPAVALWWEVVRPLSQLDMQVLSSKVAPALPQPRQTLSQIRHSHHLLAQLLSSGTPQEEASLITGYSPAYISLLKTDPTFIELQSYYATQREQRWVDVIDRMRSLGLDTLDELQNRLETEPEGWTKRELMELAELTLVKPHAPFKGGSLTATGGNSGISVNVNFVTSRASGQIIDLEPEK